MAYKPVIGRTPVTAPTTRYKPVITGVPSIEKTTPTQKPAESSGFLGFFKKHKTPYSFLKSVFTPKEEEKDFAPSVGEFAKRTATNFASMGVDAVNYVSDYIGRKPERALGTLQAITKPGLMGANLLQQKLQGYTPGEEKLFKEWSNTYKELEQRGVMPQEKVKEYTDSLLERDYMANRPEWENAPLSQKMTKYLPETLYNLGPSVVASIGWYAINPSVGMGVIAGSTAEDVESTAVEYGVEPEKAQNLGLITGVLVSALDRIVPSKTLSGEVKKKFVGGLAKRLAKSGVIESGTESLQEIIQTAAEATFRDDLGFDELSTRLAMSALGGLIGGTGMETIGNFATALRSKGISRDDMTKIEEIPTAIPARPIEKRTTVPSVVQKLVAPTDKIAPTPKPVAKVEPLLEEARKYKSADEFVEAQIPVYHGSPTPLKSFADKKGGVYFTDEYADATGFAGSPDNVYEGYLDFKKPLVIDAKGAKWNELNTKYGESTQEVVNNAQKEGYDGVIFKNIIDNIGDTADWGGQSTIYHAYKPQSSFINESQLKDIYQQAREGLDIALKQKKLEKAITPKPKKVEPVKVPKVITAVTGVKEVEPKKVIKKKPKEKPKKKAGLAETIESKAIEKNLTEGFKEVAEYSPAVIKEQSKRISKIIDEDVERAKRMVRGEERLPDDIKGALLVATMSNYAMETQDGQLLADIANSSLVTEVSEAGQTLRLVREMYKDSAFTKIQEIKKEREKAVKKALKRKTPTDIKGEIKNDLKQKVKKAKPKKKDWSAFIDEITC